MSREWWPFQRQSLADMSPRELLRDVVLSVPLGFVLTIFGAVIKTDVLKEGMSEVLLVGIAGAVFIPTVMVISYGGAKYWRYLWRNFPE